MSLGGMGEAVIKDFYDKIKKCSTPTVTVAYQNAKATQEKTKLHKSHFETLKERCEKRTAKLF